MPRNPEARNTFPTFDDIKGWRKVTVEGLCEDCGSTVVVKNGDRAEFGRARRATADTGTCPACGANIYEQKDGAKRPTEDPYHKRIKFLAVMQEHTDWPDTSYADCEQVIWDGQGWMIVDAVLYTHHGGLAIEVANKNRPEVEKMHRLSELGFSPLVVDVADETACGVDIHKAFYRCEKFYPSSRLTEYESVNPL
jgi:hypothetical protein